jgi:hypothetical protein
MDELTTFTVTCHTAGCGNGEQPIEVLAPGTDPLVICGVCSEPITDVTPSGALS